MNPRDNLMDKTYVTVIVPLYKGNKYISSVIDQIESSAKAFGGRIQLVFSNDYPDESIPDNLHSDLIDITCLQTDNNCGIQGARVKGLKAAQGDYIHFLDQDDEIEPEYYQRQMERIGDADAVVCNCTWDGEQFYDTPRRPSLSKCLTLEYNIDDDFGFVPGQVILRKESIPEYWINNWMNWNCCDDYLLWLLLFSKGKRIVANDSILYHHIYTGFNQGTNLYAWYRSTFEMLDIIRKERLFDEEIIDRFENARLKQVKLLCDSETDHLKRTRVYERILDLYSSDGNSPDEVFALKGCKIALYGYRLGIRLVPLFGKFGLDVECMVDIRDGLESSHCPVVKPDEIPNEIDCIISTLISDDTELRRQLSKKYPEKKIIGITDALGLRRQKG